MDDATYARTSERVNALVAKWKPRLGLQDWVINIVVLREGLPRKEQSEPDDSLFTTEFREFAADRCARCGSTSTVADGGEKHEERVVSHLTRLFRKFAKEAPTA